MSLMYLNFLHKHDHISIFGAWYKLFENIRLIICPISTLLLHITLFHWAGENEGPQALVLPALWYPVSPQGGRERAISMLLLPGGPFVNTDTRILRLLANKQGFFLLVGPRRLRMPKDVCLSVCMVHLQLGGPSVHLNFPLENTRV